MPKFVTTIGLEIHAELKTQTKMFCSCLNDPEERRPNINVCPVCLGHPGALPTINGDAVKKVIAVGLALGGKIGNISKFDRKSYFYPDLPKAYQISQYDEPLVSGGSLKGVKLTRIHLEEDTGRLSHQLLGSTSRDQDYSYVDFNRSSLPLMELVTDPDMNSAEQAVEFAKELQLILRYLGASDADMEKGQMRVEANLSIAESGAPLGTKVEVKNLNSFRAVRDAINYEVERQTKIIEGGGKVTQETRGWDERGVTVSQRLKEEAHDYRYMPDPDLPPLLITDKEISDIKSGIKELPEAKRERFRNDYGLSEGQLEVVLSNPKLASFLDEAESESKTIEPDIFKVHSSAVISNYLTNDLLGLMNKAGIDFDSLKIKPKQFAHFATPIARGLITRRQAQEILVKMFETGSDPEVIMENRNVSVADNIEVTDTVKIVIVDNPTAVADYKKGKSASIQFLIGKAMSKLKGRGNPESLRKLFEDLLSK